MEKRMGRPRDPKIDTRILHEARRQLRQHGYRGLRVAAVAEAAGVTAPTVRLRWPTKAELVHDAIFTDTEAPPLADTGTLAGDIEELVAAGLARWSAPEMRAGMLGLSEDLRNHPELRKPLDRRLRQPAIVALDALLERAIARGELTGVPKVSAATLIDVIAGTMLMRIVRNQSSTQELHEELSELLLRGVGARVDEPTESRRSRAARATKPPDRREPR
jgi:AcrR family transcriptional regulator